MKSALSLFFLCFLFCLPYARTQNIASDCDVDSCECIGDFFTEIEVYYFGANNVKVEVFSDQKLTQSVVSFPSVNNAQLLAIKASALPGGVFNTYIYLKVTDPGGATCTTEIFSRCPLNAWPGALDDLDILGKTYGYFTVFSHTTSEQKRRCTIDNIDQDWHVGGNVVGPVKNTLGTRNPENVVLISSDLKRGIITKDGKFGLNTQAPAALLDVQGDVLINTTLDVNGIATIHNTTASTSPATGALVVTGGAGIGSNLMVGTDAKIGKDLQVDEDLNVNKTATIGGATKINDLTASTTPATGALVVAGGAGIGQDLNVGNTVKVNSNTASTNATTGALVVTGGAGVGGNLNVGNAVKVNGTTSSTNATTGALVVGGGVGIGENLNVTGTSTLTGKVAIATTNTPGGHELYVGGSIIAEEVVVKLSGNWPDYVFDPNYKLPDLKEWQKFITAHGHLPGMPSAQQIKEQDGVAVGETQRLLVEKVEQLLLLILEQQKQIEALQTALQTKNKN